MSSSKHHGPTPPPKSDICGSTDGTSGIHPSDAIVERVRADYLAGLANRDNYPPSEFVTCLNVGRKLDPESWRDRQHADISLTSQTDALVDALARTGIDARGSNNVVAVGVITGAIQKLNGYRSICFLPLVAQRDRRPMLNELRYYRQQHETHGEYMRYGVVTNGPTVRAQGMPPPRAAGEPKDGPYFELRHRIQDLARTISRFADWARDKFGIDVVYRGTEFTVKQRGSDDFVSVHPHANVLYTPTRKLKKHEWQTFLGEAHEQLGGWHWQDEGVLKNPNEAIKYAFKPCELEGIDDATVRWLYEQTFGLKMAQPMGAFMEWRRDELTTEEWFDEPANKWRTSKIEGAKTRRRQHRKVVTMEYATGSVLSVCSVRRRPGRTKEQDRIVADDAPPPENVLMGYTMPQRRFSPYAEPCALVMNYTPEPSSEFGEEALLDIARERDWMLPVWHMNGAPDPQIALQLGYGQAWARPGEADKVRAFNVHTRSSTAERRRSGGDATGPPTADQLSLLDEMREQRANASVG